MSEPAGSSAIAATPSNAVIDAIPNDSRQEWRQMFMYAMRITWAFAASLVPLLSALSYPAVAAVVNLDLEADLVVDATHVGSDGVLSLVGTVWNSVEAGTNEPVLLSEVGATTGVSAVWPSGGAGGFDGAATNDLQDSGAFSSLEIQGLMPGVAYDIAVYGAPGMVFQFLDSTGNTFEFCTNSAPISYILPGTEGGDYCLLSDRIPADLGAGGNGFRLTPVDGLITGVQVANLDTDPPAVPTLAAGLLPALASCLGAFGFYRLRGRR
jgi:hypothetical protein